VLPRNLAVPYHQVSQTLGLPLIMVHADFVLANWKRKDPAGNLSTIVSVPGGDSLQGFVLVTLLVEVAAIPAVKVSTDVLSTVRTGVCGEQILGKSCDDGDEVWAAWIPF
ncbi:unnamed protein product, partial [Ranitomeya imitator]